MQLSIADLAVIAVNAEELQILAPAEHALVFSFEAF